MDNKKPIELETSHKHGWPIIANEVDVINENYGISRNFMNTGERFNRNLLIIDDEFASIIALLSQDKIWIQDL